MSLSREKAAELLGMKVSEVIAVEETDGKTLVTTHDGTVTEVDGSKLTTRMGDGDVAVAKATSDGPELVDGPGGRPSVVAEAMAMAMAPPVPADEDVRVVDAAAFASASAEDLAKVGVARGGTVRADTPPRDPRLDGEVPGAFDDDDLDDDLDDAPDFDGQGEEVKADRVPDGSAETVLNWVGNDKTKAERALDAEQRRERPRSTLIAALEKLKG